ncbi:MAG: D-alanyl-D-alanine carboxypeptidase/D-alanyl-D-alanine-endopeptidase [Armatimonadetes bacterium]|nr:D-alanyl-D-alanine carboxypeptidase/D-alanyl-D-alanine-endopeptidase [Armatimonadota bacterium]
MFIRKLRRLAFAAVVAALAAHAASAPAATLQDRVARLLASPNLAGGIQGVVVRSLRTGSDLVSVNADLRFMPASNMKLVTSGAYLSLVGLQTPFRTRVVTTAGLDERGVLRGDMALVGGGDPLLDTAALKGLAEAVKRAGVSAVTGRIIGDASVFEEQRYGDGWSWDDMPYYYSVPVTGLNVNENVVRVAALPGRRTGDRVQVTRALAPPWQKVRVSALTGAKGSASSLNIWRELVHDVVRVDGALALEAPEADRKPEPISVEDPPRYAAWLFRKCLVEAGVEVSGGWVAGRAPDNGRPLAEHTGAAAADLMKSLNKPSDNLVAECLLRQIGRMKGKAGSAVAGRTAVAEWLKSIGVADRDVAMFDGSGLSRQDLVTPRAIVTLLGHMRAAPAASAFVDSLPIAGVDGSLRNRMKGTPAQANCHAKTGYVMHASSLSGYVNAADGEPLVFSILMNHHNARNAQAMAVQDEIVLELARATGLGGL